MNNLKEILKPRPLVLSESTPQSQTTATSGDAKTQLNNGLRIFAALCFAPLVTFCLLMLMNALIEGDLKEPEPAVTIDFSGVFDIPDEDTGIKKTRLEDLEEVLPPPTLIIDRSVSQAGSSLMGLTDFNIVPGPAFDPSLVDSDSPVRLVGVAPDYPGGAIARGIEGYVDVQFDISKAGTTENVVILGYEPSGIFNRAVLRAVSRWRYQPRLSKGEPIPTQGLVERISFELEK